MKRIFATSGLAVLMLSILALGAAPVGADSSAVKGPVPNPYLASSLYAIVHFDSSASDSTPYGPPKGVFVVNPERQRIGYGGPGTIMTLASTNPDYMWHPAADRVQYIYKKGREWIPVAEFDVLSVLTNGAQQKIPDEALRAFGRSSAVGMTADTMSSYVTSLFGSTIPAGGGVYSVVDNNNVFYTVYNGVILGFALKDQNRPWAGIKIRYRLDNPVPRIEGAAGARLVGVQMTYDGNLIVTLSNGVAIIDRQLTLSTNVFYPFTAGERVSNSLCVDEHNGIYVASNSIMRKLIWTGKTLSDKASDGAWSAAYYTDTEKAPFGRMDNGTGSTPTLMGFGNDPDKLVVITDGAKAMNLVAFWRDEVPPGFSDRIAGQIPVTCGFDPVPEWIQSEQSVVVRGYGAFVENNVPAVIDPALLTVGGFTAYALVGPAYAPAYGAERFEWDASTHAWRSAWARPDVAGSPIPCHTDFGNAAFITGYMPNLGWVVQGLDWDTGNTVHLTFLGTRNIGNGYYGLLQFLKDGDLIFNGMVGSMRIHFDTWDTNNMWNDNDPWHR